MSTYFLFICFYFNRRAHICHLLSFLLWFLDEISRLKLRMPWLYFGKCKIMTIVAKMHENLIYYSSVRFCFRNNFIGVKAYSITKIEIMLIRVIENDSVSFEVTQNPYIFWSIQIRLLKKLGILYFFFTFC